jgi:hypothetical protein
MYMYESEGEGGSMRDDEEATRLLDDTRVLRAASGERRCGGVTLRLEAGRPDADAW